MDVENGNVDEYIMIKLWLIFDILNIFSSYSNYIFKACQLKLLKVFVNFMAKIENIFEEFDFSTENLIQICQAQNQNFGFIFRKISDILETSKSILFFEFSLTYKILRLT